MSAAASTSDFLRKPVPKDAASLVGSLTSIACANPKAIQGHVHAYPLQAPVASEATGPVSTYRRRLGESSRAGRLQSKDTQDEGLSEEPAKEAGDGDGQNKARLMPTSSSVDEPPAASRFVIGWKMTEHLYRRRDCPFPCLARGLFTANGDFTDPERDRMEGSSKVVQASRIVARGYDKFFSVDEVDYTKWSAIERHTAPPYTLTFKSNGCLILISALTPTECLVTSKHAMPPGPLPEELIFASEGKLPSAAERSAQLDNLKRSRGKPSDEQLDHATMGQVWLRWTLGVAGKSEKDLAAELWDKGLTAVAELCDDSFESHVLIISERMTGLHLHGLNRNVPGFLTLPPDEVNQFAGRWGLIATEYVDFESLAELKRYTEDIAKTGHWQDEEVEGFVIRSRVRISDSEGASSSDVPPPAANGSSFFWKYKLEEPYLTYRQYREITRALLSKARLIDGTYRLPSDPFKDIASKIKRPDFVDYARWCVEKMKTDPVLFEDYDRGVVRVREAFLKDHASMEKSGTGAKVQKVKTLIVPVAVPGCGKTLLGVALSNLFGLGHTQSDDVTTKRSAPTFLKNISTLLKSQDVVYADRNNHLDKHHDELVKLADQMSDADVRIQTICLLWDVDHHAFNKALRITSERILARGDNHQSLRIDPNDQLRHEAVVKQFMSEFSPPEGGKFDHTIRLSLESGLGDNFRTTVDQLVQILSLPRPTEAEIEGALSKTGSYRTDVRKELQGKPTPEPRYFAVAVELDLAQTVQQVLSSIRSEESKASAVEDASAFLDHLVSHSRITAKPHATLVHETSVKTESDAGISEGPQSKLWAACEQLRRLPSPTRFSFEITALLWSERVMTLVVENFKPFEDNHESDDALKIEQALCDTLKGVLHLTVGTADQAIAPYEARGLVEIWRKHKQESKIESEGMPTIYALSVKNVAGTGRVMGLS